MNTPQIPSSPEVEMSLLASASTPELGPQKACKVGGHRLVKDSHGMKQKASGHRRMWWEGQVWSHQIPQASLWLFGLESLTNLHPCPSGPMRSAECSSSSGDMFSLPSSCSPC